VLHLISILSIEIHLGEANARAYDQFAADVYFFCWLARIGYAILEELDGAIPDRPSGNFTKLRQGSMNSSE